MHLRHDPILDRLQANISHELGIPLRAILGAATVGMDRPALPNQMAYQIFTAIQHQAQHLLRDDLYGDVQSFGFLLSERFGYAPPVELEAAARPSLGRWAQDLPLNVILQEIAQRMRVRLRRIFHLAEQVVTTEESLTRDHLELAYGIMRHTWMAIGVVDVYVEDAFITWIRQQRLDIVRLDE
jgi:signal transduction histidine kinase